MPRKFGTFGPTSAEVKKGRRSRLASFEDVDSSVEAEESA
jgi:hypothetical protein